MNILNSLGQKIKYYRKQLKLTQEEVAKQANISSRYVGQIERGEVNSSIIIL